MVKSQQPESKTVKLTAKAGTSLYKIFTYLEAHGLELHPQVLETVLNCYLPMILPLEESRSRDYALNCANKVEAIAKMIRERFGLNQGVVSVLPSVSIPQLEVENNKIAESESFSSTVELVETNVNEPSEASKTVSALGWEG